MINIKKHSDLLNVTCSQIRSLINLRLNQIGSGFFANVIEPGDTIPSLEELSNYPILSNPLNDSVYGDEDFVCTGQLFSDTQIGCISAILSS